MIPSAFDAIVQNVFKKLDDISKTKGKEYANSGDRLANFKRLHEKIGVTPETVCLIFGTKHMDSIDSYVKTLESTGLEPTGLSEPIDGRIQDAIMYLLLLYALILERRGET